MINESEFRNAMAHFHVGTAPFEEPHFFLLPNLLDPGEKYRTSDRVKKKLDKIAISDVRAAVNRFRTLSVDIGQFQFRLPFSLRNPQL